MKHGRIAMVGLAATLLARLAVAQDAPIPPPIQPGGDGGLIFSAWDAERSYSLWLGQETIFSFDPTTPQTFQLPDFVGYFPNLDAVSYNILAGDGEGDGFFEGGLAFYSTGSVTNLTNDAGMRTVIAALDNFIRDTNQACPGSGACLATSADTHYAGRESYGARLGLSGGYNSQGQPGQPLAFVLAENEAFNPDAQVTVTDQPFSWFLDGQRGVLSYGEEAVIPVPAGMYLLVSGLVFAFGFRSRARIA